MTKWVCTICIAKHGLKGTDLHKWPDSDDEDGRIKHLIIVHGVRVEGYDDTTGERVT
jgi:hypothetical protein